VSWIRIDLLLLGQHGLDGRYPHPRPLSACHGGVSHLIEVICLDGELDDSGIYQRQLSRQDDGLGMLIGKVTFRAVNAASSDLQPQLHGLVNSSIFITL